jgi:hypothetical protein
MPLPLIWKKSEGEVGVVGIALEVAGRYLIWPSPHISYKKSLRASKMR